MAIAINGTDGNPLTTRDVDASPNNFVFVCGRFAFSGNYATGGDTLDWTTVIGLCIPASLLLQLFVDWSTPTNGFWPIGNLTTALNAWKLKVTTTAFGSELGAGAYSAAVTNDTVVYQACFRKMVA